MDHDTYKERLSLLLYDELEGGKREELDAHLRTCKDCQAELEQLKKLHAALSSFADRTAVDDRVLREARQQLREALRRERQRHTVWEQWRDALEGFMIPGYRAALGGVAVLALGIVIGRYTLAPETRQEAPALQLVSTAAAPVEGSTKITNVRFIKSAMNPGEVEFTFNAVTPVHMKGSVDDPRIQKVLTHAMLNEENPAVRIRAASAIGSPRIEPADRAVKTALILALQGDDNAAVRKEALRALQKLSFDDDIKNALLHTLKYDKNPGLRIAAINGLDSMSSPGKQIDADMLKILKSTANSDENNYIRIRANAILQEVRNK